jgi:protoporphyrinogen oxidase
VQGFFAVMNRHVAVIGAGITGLVAARELARVGWSVEVFERWPDVAGQASAFDVGSGVLVERYYHHFFRSDLEMVALHDELLPGELEWHRSSVGMFARDRIWPFTTPRDLLAYSPVPLVDRVRLGLAMLSLARRSDWERMDDIGALEWLRKATGPRALDAVWTPLLLGKFGPDAERIPLAWLWSKLVLRRQKLGGSGATREELGYPRRSFQAIAGALAQDIKTRGGVIRLDQEVISVQRDVDGFLVQSAPLGAYRKPAGAAGIDPGRSSRADVVLLTTPTGVSARLVDWPSEFRSRLLDWRYRVAVVLLLELRRQFTTTYWLNNADRSVPFLGVIEHTNLVPQERYPARYVYVSNYVDATDGLVSMTTDDILARYLPALRRIAPAFDPHDILRAWSFREEAAQPIPEIGNRRRILPFQTPISRVFLANTTQIYPEDRGTNYSVRLGRDIAAAIGPAESVTPKAT